MSSMIIFEDDLVETTWANRTASHYQGLGYKKLENGERFMVNPFHLPNFSREKVVVRCPFCNEARLAKKQNVVRRGSSACYRCATRLANAAEIAGQRFGKLLVQYRLDDTHIDSNGSLFWMCACDCGRQVVVSTSSLTSGHTKSCGCLVIELSRQRHGVNSPNWNPNLTDEEREENRDYPAYLAWRLLVYQRDKFTCQKCGHSKTRTLNAHHLYNFAGHPAMRTNVDNGVTLCRNCHKEFHRLYGNQGNTPEQFQQYKENNHGQRSVDKRNGANGGIDRRANGSLCLAG